MHEDVVHGVQSGAGSAFAVVEEAEQVAVIEEAEQVAVIEEAREVAVAEEEVGEAGDAVGVGVAGFLMLNRGTGTVFPYTLPR
ncbi:hypothetical protein ACQPYE_39755 [Actinosynnema sp. CA-299493]